MNRFYKPGVAASIQAGLSELSCPSHYLLYFFTLTFIYLTLFTPKIILFELYISLHKENETKTITERPNLLKEAIIAKPVIKPENKKPTIPKPEAKADKGTEDKKKAKEDRNKDKQQEGGGGWKDGGDDEEGLPLPTIFYFNKKKKTIQPR